MTNRDDKLSRLLRSVGESTPVEDGDDAAFSREVTCLARSRQSRRRRRQLIGSLTGCYVGGLLTMWLWLGAPGTGVLEGNSAQGEPRIAHPTNTAALAENLSNGARPAANDQENVEPFEDEDAVADGLPTMYAFFRDLGDSSHARGDFEASLRYYRLALDSASSEELEIDGMAENSLLMSLKQERLETTTTSNSGVSI